MIIPDCTYCGKKVVVDFDVEDTATGTRVQTMEVCTGCGVGQRVLQILPPDQVAQIRQEIRAAYLEVQRLRQRSMAITEGWRNRQRDGAA